MIRRIVLFIAENFGNDVALEKLDYLEKSIMSLGDNPYIGAEPRYNVLKRQGYLVLILEKDIVIYKVDDDKKVVTVYAVVDQRQDYLSIIRGL
ncbi:MAG: type II toxin-antitoxin system RelE/ParE family toxin [Lachnospiraceae bacterium]|nr:type II toxin-antitoxin system RelE/ParE family toxin [Lachnospiraceae bacterium]